MKKISYYLIFIVIVGIALLSFWTYQKYFKQEGPSFLLFKVERGSIQDVVKARGEVVAQKDFDLEFPFSGIVERVFVQEGERVSQNDPLIKLETTDFELEIQMLQAQRAQAEAGLATQKAKLAELQRGTRPEEIQVQEVKVENTKVALEDAQKNLVDKLQDAYTRSDDAIRGKADQMFTDPQTQNPQLQFSAIDPNLENDVERRRVVLEYTIFPQWKPSLDVLTPQSDLGARAAEGKKYLDDVKVFLDNLSLIINNPSNAFYVVNGTSKEIPGSWKTDIASARTNINTAINTITSADEKLKTAESNFALAKQELALKEAGAVPEQISAQEAQVKQAEADTKNVQAQIAIVQEKIRKSTLYSPGTATIVKIRFEKQELFRFGEPAISLSAVGHKIQADISELEIGKVREIDGNEVVIRLDAFPGLELTGKIVSIEPREIIKEGDKYYRTNVYIEPHDLEIRSGMNADLAILIFSKENVLTIPEFAVQQRDGKKFATILEGELKKEVEVETGLSDDESIEITKGLSEGQTIMVSTD